MPLITIASDIICEYHGEAEPAEARLYASVDFRTNEGVFIAKGSVSGDGDFYQNFGASRDGEYIRIATGSAYSNFSTKARYTLAVYDTFGSLLKVVFTNIRIPDLVSPTTWAQIQIASASRAGIAPATYLDDQAIIALVNNNSNTSLPASELAKGGVRLNSAPANPADPIAVGPNDPLLTAKATDADFGRIKLNTPAADPNNPLAVGPNDPLVTQLSTDGVAGKTRLTKAAANPAVPIAVGANEASFLSAKETVYARDYASVSAAVAAIGGASRELRISETQSVAASLTIPSNVVVSFDGNGMLDVASGQTVTIHTLKDPGHRQVFTGSGNVRLGSNASTHIDIAWWCGYSGTISAPQWENIRQSAFNSSGAKVLVPAGVWSFAGDIDVVSGVTYQGYGVNMNALTGATFRLTANNKALFNIPVDHRNVTFDNILFDMSGVTGGRGVKTTLAGVGSTISNIAFRNCLFKGGTVGVYIGDDVDGGGLAQDISFENCRFDLQTVAGIHLNTNNCGVTLKDVTCQPAQNGTSRGLDIERAGWVSVIGGFFDGFNLSVGTVQHDFTSAAVNTSNDTITINGHGLTTKDPVSFTTAGTIAAPLPTNGSLVYVRAVDGNTLKFYYTPIDANADTNAIDLTTAGSGTSRLLSLRPIFTGRPRAAIRVRGHLGALNITGNQCEGIAYYLEVSDVPNIETNINISGSLVQSLCSIRSPITVISKGNKHYARAFVDADSTGGARLISLDDVPYTFGGFIRDASGAVPPTVSFKWDAFVNESVTVYSSRRDANEIVGQPTRHFIGSAYNGDTASPVLVLSSTYYDRILLKLGIANYAGTPHLAYDVKRLSGGAFEGFLDITGNQGFPYDGLHLPQRLAIGGIIQKTAKYALTPAATITLDCNQANRFTLTPDQNCTIDAINLHDGQELELVLLTSGTSSFNVTFGTGFKAGAALVTGTVTDKYFVVKFTSDGTNLIEVSRTAAL